MTNKKFILMAILLSLIAISAVSANDLNTTDEVAINDDLIIEETTDDVSNENMLGVKDDGTFTALQDKINNAAEGSTITLENDYAYDEGFNASGIVISKALTIEGNGHTLNGMSKSRIFHMIDENLSFIRGGEYHVVLNNLNLINGYAQDGGAICLEADSKLVAYLDSSNHVKYTTVSYAFHLTANNCNFTNNKADGNGGAIYASWSTTYSKNLIMVYGSTFNNNQAKAGGAISNRGTNVSAVNSNFNNNKASDKGGALMADLVDADNCVFTGNSAGCGGAVYASTSSILSSSFESNSANEEGGAFYGPKGVISDSSFRNNFAVSGGAMKVSGVFYIDGSTFISNNATDGGAVYCYNANITDCIFKKNTAEMGGAIYTMEPSKSSVTINSIVVNCDFQDNEATVNGASIAALGATSIAESNFKHSADCEFIYFYTQNSKNKLLLLKNNMESEFRYDVRVKYSYLDFKINLVFLNSTISKGDTFELCRCVDDMGNIIRLDDGHVRIKVVDSNGNVVRDNFLIDFSHYALTNDFLDDGVYTTSGVMGKDTIEYNLIPGKITVNSFKIIASDLVKYYGGSEKYSIRLTDNAGSSIAGADVKVTVNGKTYNVKTDSNGKAGVPLDLPVGTYHVVIEYGSTSATSKVTVKSTIAASDASGTYSNSKVTATFLNIDGKALANTKVTFKAGGKSFTAATDSKGVATADVDLEVGNYNVTAINPVTKEEKLFKLSISIPDANIIPQNLNADYASGTFTFKLVDAVTNKPLAGKILSFSAYSVTLHVTTDKNGIATVNNSNLQMFKHENGTFSFKNNIDVGKHPITIKGDDSSVNVSEFKDYITVGQATINIKIDSYREYYQSGKKACITVTNAKTGVPMKGIVLHLYIENTTAKDYFVQTGENGISEIDVSGLNLGIYSLTVTNNDTGNIAGKKVGGTITILDPASKTTPKLTANSVSIVYGQHKNLVVNLMDSNGKPIVNRGVYIELSGLKFSDSTGYINTDENGQVEIDCYAYLPDTYTVHIRSKDCEEITTKVVVKKLTPKITASKKTFKVKATKKYTITLKTNKNKAIKSKKVKLTVNGKTYTAKTDSKGKATFKITKLTKKGTFKAVIKYAGNTYYCKATKTVKITTR